VGKVMRLNFEKHPEEIIKEAHNYMLSN